MNEKRKRTAVPHHDWFDMYPPEDREQARRRFRLYMDDWFNQAFAAMGFSPEPKSATVIPFSKNRKRTSGK